MESRQSEDGYAVWGAMDDTSWVAGAPGAAGTPPSPSGPATAPPGAPGPDPSALARKGRVEQLRSALLPANRGQHTPAVLEQLEGEYLDAVMALEAPEETPPSVARSAAPTGTPVVEFDAETWLRRLGPPRGVDNDIDVPDGYTWDHQALNQAQAAFTSLGFPGHITDDFADAERQMAATSWTEAEGRAALAATHGSATAEWMISNAQVMLEIMWEHAFGRARIARWEQVGGLTHPALIEALAKALEAQPRDNDRYFDLVLKRAARWGTRRRGGQQ
jgi:hypothetical protein